MKSISNSDHIYCKIACQKAIPRFLLISVKYLWLSTFPKVADLIGARSLITSHFLWQVCPAGKCISGTLGSSSRPPPFALSPRLEGGELPEPQPRSGVRKQKEDHVCGQENGAGLPVSPGVRSCRGPPCAHSVQWPRAIRPAAGPPVFLLPLLADFCVDRCALLAAARSSWQEDSSLSSQKWNLSPPCSPPLCFHV